MVITATELKQNLGKYLDTVSNEDIYVMRNGRIVAKISNPANDKVSILDGLVGIAGELTLTAEEARAERLMGA